VGLLPVDEEIIVRGKRAMEIVVSLQKYARSQNYDFLHPNDRTLLIRKATGEWAFSVKVVTMPDRAISVGIRLLIGLPESDLVIFIGEIRRFLEGASEQAIELPFDASPDGR
jgi:hypothetical protein